jgi:hypothetical protein
MEKLTQEQIQEYLHKSYTAVDGLWFMKVEERNGFDAALETDIAVWQVLPKIQARLLKKFLGVDQGMDAFEKCFSAKLAMDKYDFTMDKSDSHLTFNVHACHWHQLMVKSGRDGLFKDIGNLICSAEFTTFMEEFGDNIQYEQHDQICSGANCCHFQFSMHGEAENKVNSSE